jgi:hypothetical protein
MDLTLTRTDIQAQGVFSVLDGGTSRLYTCEHAYQDANGAWAAKIPNGSYTCVRGAHTLDGKTWFSTFEITGVPGHSGLLFHMGNTEDDSEGCVLLGMGYFTLNGMKAVFKSAVGFTAFSTYQTGCDQFTLTVSGP